MPSVYLRVIEDGMIVNSWEKHLHHVGLVIQRWSTKGLQICSQVRHICLEFGKGCTQRIGRKSVNLARLKRPLNFFFYLYDQLIFYIQ
jgi:hypothetical protein